MKTGDEFWNELVDKIDMLVITKIEPISRSEQLVTYEDGTTEVLRDTSKTSRDVRPFKKITGITVATYNV